METSRDHTESVWSQHILMEVNCEAPESIANEVAMKLYDCMVKAGAYFCTRCKLDADISWDKDSEGNEIKGQLPTCWIH